MGPVRLKFNWLGWLFLGTKGVSDRTVNRVQLDCQLAVIRTSSCVKDWNKLCSVRKKLWLLIQLLPGIHQDRFGVQVLVSIRRNVDPVEASGLEQGQSGIISRWCADSYVTFTWPVSGCCGIGWGCWRIKVYFQTEFWLYFLGSNFQKLAQVRTGS